MTKRMTIVVIGSLRVKKPSDIYCIYPENWDTSATYHKIWNSPFYYLLICLKYYFMRLIKCRIMWRLIWVYTVYKGVSIPIPRVITVCIIIWHINKTIWHSLKNITIFTHNHNNFGLMQKARCLIWVYTVYKGLSVPIPWVITICIIICHINKTIWHSLKNITIFTQNHNNFGLMQKARCLIWVYTVYKGLSVPIPRVITVCIIIWHINKTIWHSLKKHYNIHS